MKTEAGRKKCMVFLAYFYLKKNTSTVVYEYFYLSLAMLKWDFITDVGTLLYVLFKAHSFITPWRGMTSLG